jgi:hypothetical protein
MSSVDASLVTDMKTNDYATSRKVAGSSPDEVGFFNGPNPTSRTMALESTKPLTEISTRNLPGGGGKGRPARKADNLTDYRWGWTDRRIHRYRDSIIPSFGSRLKCCLQQ